MSRNISYTAEQRAEIIRLRDEGAGWTEIAKQLGVSQQGVRTSYYRDRSLAPTPRNSHVAAMPEVPRDTRSLTGRLCGDPLSGRSALDKRRSA